MIEDAQLDLGGSSVETQSGQAAGRMGVVEAVVMSGSALVGCSSAELDLATAQTWQPAYRDADLECGDPIAQRPG